MADETAPSRRPVLRTARRDRVALITWPRAHHARVGLNLSLEWDRVAEAHPNVVPVALAGYALAQALAAHPVANRRVAIWGIRPNPTVRLSFAIDVKNDLRIAVVDRADKFDPRQFQLALRRAARAARAGKGRLAMATRLIEMLPVPVGRPVLRVWSAITAGLGIGALGISGAPFGAALISSVARFGLPAVDVPFVAFTRCAMVCSVGTVTPAVVARNGQPVVVDVVEIRVSYDHRVCDAGQLAGLLESFLAACYEPASGGGAQPA